MIVKLDDAGQEVQVQFAAFAPKPPVFEYVSGRAPFINIIRYEWRETELRLYAPKDIIVIPRQFVSYIIIKAPQDESH